MKNKTSKLAVTLLAVFCLIVTVFVGSMETKAADDTYVTETYSVADAKAYFTGDTAPECKTDGYIFAGWYAESDTIETDSETGIGYFVGEPLRTVTGYTGTNVTALFVDEAVLGVKAQIAIMDNDGDTSKATPSDENVNIRFVTSVDTLKYQKVGLGVTYTYNGELRERESVTNTVYKQITVADGTDGTADETMNPSQVFSARSQYFKAYTMTKIPMDAFETELSVRAYWETIDGARVYGSSTPVVKTVQQGVYHTYEAGVDNTYYKIIETAVGTVGDTDTKTVTLFKNAEVESDMEITGNVTITNREGANITLYRAAGLTADGDKVFTVSSGAMLTIEGTTDANSIVLDGRTADGDEVVGETMVYSDTATLTIKNATLRNAKNTKTNDGGAIHAKTGTVYVENVKFIDNYSKYGAAIRTTAQTTIKKCVFGGEGDGNQVTTQGGAMYIQTGATVDVFDSEFSYNSSSSRGGAIYLNKGTLNVTNTKFAHNTATTSGGAIYNAGAQMTFTAENEEKDSTLAIFEYNVSNDSTDAMGGGAILTGNATGVLDVTGYIFRYNQAKKTGGAICARNGEVTIEDAEFIGNYTTGASGHGGAVAYAYASAADFTITGTTFTENHTQGSAAHGGAVYVADSTKTTVNTDITTANTYSGNDVNADDATNSSDGSENGVYIAK